MNESATTTELTLQQKLANLERAAGYERELDAWGRSNLRSEALEADIEEAFTLVGRVEYLQKQAEANPKAFMRLLEKLIVKRTTAKHEHKPMLPDDWQSKAAQTLVQIQADRAIEADTVGVID